VVMKATSRKAMRTVLQAVPCGIETLTPPKPAPHRFASK
jgi:hypothetical protein